jgi:radical SAM/Cys-rich protein
MISTALPWNSPVTRTTLSTLQINLGRYCNLACVHCHVEAGPKRTEMIAADTLEKIMVWITQYRPVTVDLTGGAPELIPGFRRLVTHARTCGATVIDRCNLAVLDEPGQEDLGTFLAQQQVQIVASLPCYLKENVDAQRGKGTYDRSIRALQQLNKFGYGRDPKLPLYLVYNPGGIGLPPKESDLEKDYRARLKQDWDIDFTHLWCLTNVPITRWRTYLERQGKLAQYEEKLRDNYNPATLDGLMCRSTLSVDWRGRLYDCDFNQALDLDMPGGVRYLWDISPDNLTNQPISMDQHCLACTAGCGSSCSGSVTKG